MSLTNLITAKSNSTRYVVNEGVFVGIHQTPFSLDREPDPTPYGGFFQFWDPTPRAGPDSYRGLPSPKKTIEDIMPLEIVEKKENVSVEYITPRGETAVKIGGARALTSFFDQFCELSA